MPVVLLVLEGGVNTLKTVLEALRKKTPVVVIQGSGRAADFIAMAYKENRHREQVYLYNSFTIYHSPNVS